jgi:hypothetical protein
MPPDDELSEVLDALIGAFGPPAIPVSAMLQERLAHVAAQHGTATAWDWIERQAGLSLPDETRAMMEGHILAWLTYVRPVSEPPAYNRLAATALHLAKAIDDDPLFAAYLPTLQQLAQDLQDQQDQHQRQRGNVARDKELIRGLAGYFPKVTSAPTGTFCRLLDAVWEILPSDQRCARGALVQYVKTAWDGEETSPLRKRPKRSP